MALTGRALEYLLVLATLAFPVAAVLLWSRVRGPRVVRGITRLAMLLAGQLATLALALVLVNNYNTFYSSWSDLLGVGGGASRIVQYGGPQKGAPAERRVATTTRGVATGKLQIQSGTSWSTPQQWSTRGKVVNSTVTGLGSGLSTPAFIYLPPQYFWAKYAHHTFPAVEVLTGYPGSAPSLVTRMHYPDRALALVRAHKSTPMIYVMLSSHPTPRDAECTDIPGGPQAQTFLSSELTSAVEHALRVQPGHWGIVGDSTGGYCAAKLTMLYPWRYAGGVSLSGYYHALPGGTAGDIFGGSIDRQHENDLRWRLKNLPVPPASLYVTISRKETYQAEGYPETMKFLRLVRAPMRVTAAIESTGGHNFYVWNRELPKALTWLSARITAPTTP